MNSGATVLEFRSCLMCGTKFMLDHRGGARKIFCSEVCGQAEWRQRKRESEGLAPAVVPWQPVCGSCGDLGDPGATICMGCGGRLT